ncbi:MAG: hypothetical protein GTO17_13390 [Candidatus Aminicenantes bacterium]|nr:hypothetical protein [Candidatus Aminicenantes bacterium]
MGIPYGSIGNILALALAILAFSMAENKGRIIIATVMGSLFILPYLFSSAALSIICFVGRMVFGIGCLLYIKWQGTL